MSDPTPLAMTLCYLMSALVCGVGIWVHRRGLHPAAPPPAPLGKVPVWFYKPVDLVAPIALIGVQIGFFALSDTNSKPTLEDYTADTLIASMVIQCMFAGVTVIIACQRAPLTLWLGLRWNEWPRAFLIGPACVIAMWLIQWTMESLGYSEWIRSLGVKPVQDTVKLFQESNHYVVIALMSFMAVIVAPICEEIVYRGFIYPIMKCFSGAWVAAIVSALVFAAAHGDLAPLLPLFLLGLLLVWAYERTGSIWAPIAVHFFFNAATVCFQLAIRIFDLPIPEDLL